MWLALNSLWEPVLGATIVLGAGEGYAYNSYTDPAARGYAVQPAVANFMIKHEQSLRLTRHFYYVLRHNYSGLKIVAGRHAPAQAIPSRTVRLIRFLGSRVSC